MFPWATFTWRHELGHIIINILKEQFGKEKLDNLSKHILQLYGKTEL